VQLVPAPAVAEVIGVLWHQEKGYWIALAVVIVVRRRGGSLLTPELSTVGYRLSDTVIGCLIAIVPTVLLRRRHVG
jgi:uncharacterized membrane protein YccC